METSQSKAATSEKPARETGQALSIEAAVAKTVKPLLEPGITEQQAAELLSSEVATLSGLQSILDDDQVVLPEGTQRAMLNSRGVGISIKMKLALRKDLSPQAQASLAGAGRHVAERLLDNESLAQSTLVLLSRRDDLSESALDRIIDHPQSPPDVLENASKSAQASTRRQVARAPGVTPELLTRLSKDNEATVREAVAGNPKTPEAVLIALAKSDKDSDVLENIARRDLTPALLTALLPRTSEEGLEGVADYLMGNDSSAELITPEMLTKFYDEASDRPRTRRLAVEHVNAPKPLLEKALKDLDEDIAEIAVGKADQAVVSQMLENGELSPALLSKANASPEAIQRTYDRFVKEAKGDKEKLTDGFSPFLENKRTPETVTSAIVQWFIDNEHVPSDDVIVRFATRKDIPLSYKRTLFQAPGVGRRAKDAIFNNLPTEERVALKSQVPEDVAEKGHLYSYDPQKYALRWFLRIMRENNAASVSKQDMKKPPYDVFMGKPSVENLFKASSGKPVTKEMVEEAIKAPGDSAREYYIQWTQTSEFAQYQRDREVPWYGEERSNMVVGVKDVDLDPKTQEFLAEIAPGLRTSAHDSIGLGKNNVGWVLYKLVKPKKKKDGPKYVVIEQLQSDYRDVVGIVRALRENDNKRLAELYTRGQEGDNWKAPEDEWSSSMRTRFEEGKATAKSKRGDFDEWAAENGEAVVTQVQKDLEELIKEYPERIMDAFLQRWAGWRVVMPTEEKSRQLTSMSPTTANIVYRQTPKKFGFRPSTEFPGYQETIAASKKNLRANSSPNADNSESPKPEGWQGVTEGESSEGSGVHNPDLDKKDEFFLEKPRIKKKPKPGGANARR